MFGLAGHADWYDRLPGRLAGPLYRRIAADVASAGLADGGFVLDVGTGPGRVPRLIAQRCPSLIVEGIDLSEQMIARARARIPAGGEARIRFEVADASRLPYDDEAFDLVSLANMIPFFDELARVVAPGGHVLLSFSGGPSTPIYVRPETLRRELAARGFTDFADFEAGSGTALLAHKRDPS